MAESELAGGSFILRGMSGAAVFSPGGSSLDFKAKSCKAWVVDRRLFDRALALDALREGAELRLCSSVRKMRWDEGSCILTLAGGEEIEARIVISAEGGQGQAGPSGRHYAASDDPLRGAGGGSLCCGGS